MRIGLLDRHTGRPQKPRSSPTGAFLLLPRGWSGARRRPILKMTSSILAGGAVMGLDRDAERVLEMVRLSGRPPYETLSAPEARKLFLAAREVLAPDPPPVAEIRELAAPGPTGAAVPLRLYRGATTPPGEILPALVYCHGGGWVIGDLDTHDSLCRHLANAARCVVAVDYRLAPEHKFPAAVEDCVAATSWVAQEAAALGIDPERLAVGGDSAGGNLAAVVSLIARDRGLPRLRCQALLYPAVECGMTHPSHDRFAEGVS